MFKNITLFFITMKGSKLSLVRERMREMWGCYDWHHTFLTHIVIHIFWALLLYCLSWKPDTELVFNLQADTPTLLTDHLRLGSKHFCHYIIFWRPHIFSSGMIHMIHFCCPLFTLNIGVYPVYEIHTNQLSKVNI